MVGKVSEQEIRMNLGGMTCSSCEEHVGKALAGAGAKDIEVSYRRGEARFRVASGADMTHLSEAVAKVGYRPGEWQVVNRQTGGGSPGGDGHGNEPYDLAIIGSGGAAFAAAIRARSHGARVAMIERGTVGGTCVNIGCVPSKALLRAAEIYFQARNNPFAGLGTSAAPVDLGLLVGQKNRLVAYMRQEKYVDLIAEYGFDLISGEARFVDEHSLQVGEEKIRASHFLIATGASPAVPDIPGLVDVPYLTSTSALELKEVPKSLVVIGAGYIALELGQFFHHLGAQVTLLQRSARLLKRYDPEISEAISQALRDKGIDVITGVRYRNVEGDGRTSRVHFEKGGKVHAVEAERLLVAAGRQPNTASLGLANVCVKVGSQGEVLVDEHLRTNIPHIFAAGDVTLGPQFVYVAAYQGTLAADNALGVADRRVDLRAVPAVTFTNPSVATVGLTEAEAREAGYEVKTSILPLKAVPRALVNRETTGVYKLVADVQTGKIIGAHIVAENAGDVIYAATLAVKFGLTVKDLKETLAPYLTMSEGLKLAALTFDTSVSKLSCCAG